MLERGASGVKVPATNPIKMTRQEKDTYCRSQDEGEWGKGTFYKVSENIITKY